MKCEDLAHITGPEQVATMMAVPAVLQQYAPYRAPRNSMPARQQCQTPLLLN